MEKPGLKFSIQKTRVMAFSHITSWQIDGEKMEAVTDLIFLGSQITADDDRVHGSKTCLFLGRKAVTNRDSILRSKDISLPTKVHIANAMIVPALLIYGCES